MCTTCNPCAPDTTVPSTTVRTDVVDEESGEAVSEESGDNERPVDGVSGVVRAFWSVAERASAEVARALGSTSDWGESGARPGQYRVDLVADELCVRALHEAGFAVLSEESGRSGPSGAPLVVVDPLDGSTNASRGLRWCATSMCVVDAHGPEAAWIFDHGSTDVLIAARGHGAFRNGRQLQVTPCADLSAAIVGVSGLPSHHYGWAQFRALGAAALDIAAVATGMLDAWCDMSTDAHGVWDYLAAVLVATEAGCVAADAHGRELCVTDPLARRTPVVASHLDLLARLLSERNGPSR